MGTSRASQPGVGYLHVFCFFFSHFRIFSTCFSFSYRVSLSCFKHGPICSDSTGKTVNTGLKDEGGGGGRKGKTRITNNTANLQ